MDKLQQSRQTPYLWETDNRIISQTINLEIQKSILRCTKTFAYYITRTLVATPCTTHTTLVAASTTFMPTWIATTGTTSTANVFTNNSQVSNVLKIIPKQTTT